MNKFGIIALVLVLVGGFLLLNKSGSKEVENTTDILLETENNKVENVEVVDVDASIQETANTNTQNNTQETKETSIVKSFTVEGNNFDFSIKEMKVKKGDTVKVTFINKEGFHDWVVDEFSGAQTKQIKAGATETIEFVADKTGVFEYYCSVGSHRAQGMVGKLVVE